MFVRRFFSRSWQNPFFMANLTPQLAHCPGRPRNHAMIAVAATTTTVCNG
mgnify:CR=1 FL=1